MVPTGLVLNGCFSVIVSDLYQGSFLLGTKKTEYCRALHHNMEVDNNSEKVAILDAGAQYGKVINYF